MCLATSVVRVVEPSEAERKSFVSELLNKLE